MDFEISFPSEKTIEDYVCRRMEDHSICPVSNDYVAHFVRQHEISGYGVTDVIKFHVSDNVLFATILELKNEPLKEIHLAQLSRYMVGLSRQLKRYGDRLGVKLAVRGQLAGPFEIRGDFVYLADQLPYIKIFDLRLSLDEGFLSSPVGRGWHNKSENKKSAKSLVRQLFDNDIFVFDPPSPVNPKRYVGFD